MDLYSRIKNEFLFGGHILTLGSSCVAASATIILGKKQNLSLLVLLYLIFYIIYLFDHSRGAETDALTNPQRAFYLEGKLEIQKIILEISFLLVVVILIAKGNLNVFVCGIVILVMGVAYGSFFKKFTEKIFAFKNFFVSAVWSVLVFYTVLYLAISLNFSAVLFVFLVFVRMLSVQIFFDIRDTKGGKEKRLLTVPAVWGDKKSVGIIYAADFITVVLAFMASLYRFSGAGIWIFFPLVVLYRAFYMQKYFQKDQNCFLWAAGEPIVWFLILFIGHGYEFFLA